MALGPTLISRTRPNWSLPTRKPGFLTHFFTALGGKMACLSPISLLRYQIFYLFVFLNKGVFMVPEIKIVDFVCFVIGMVRKTNGIYSLSWTEGQSSYESWYCSTSETWARGTIFIPHNFRAWLVCYLFSVFISYQLFVFITYFIGNSENKKMFLLYLLPKIENENRK